jgi:FkbM family methyltransferase
MQMYRTTVVLCVLCITVVVVLLFGPTTICVNNNNDDVVAVTTTTTSEPNPPAATVVVRTGYEVTEALNASLRQRWLSSRPEGERGVASLQRLLGLLVDDSHVAADIVDAERFTVVIDVGGNVGQTTSRLMHEIVRRRGRDFVMLTFEPMKAYDAIVDRAQRERWDTSLFVVFQCAVGGAAGQTTFYFDTDQSEQSSQDSEAAGTDKFSRNVTVITMDQFFHARIPDTIARSGNAVAINATESGAVQAMNVFFYKVDTEGYDMDVLLAGSERLLRTQRVRFLEFEYNHKWFSRGRNLTLRRMVNTLYDTYRYECYFISARYLHPLFGVWWRAEMEIRGWSNVFCGLRGDRYLRWIVRRFDYQDFSPLAPVDLVEFFGDSR